MGLFSTISNWKTASYEKHKSNMQSLGHCPDCSGAGMILYPALSSSFYIPTYDCPGCNGSGLYTDWFEDNQ
ncbi:methionine aminopeptidase [Ectobacillus funiculus]|jgi:hypothetical protein|uniref:methionine aminopeptidase n=1 Tax=Ectobacillus funiculus TaxID=137993 RepID=UPI00397C840E